MIKLMIVDDEAVIRHGLRQSVDWEAHGVTIVGEAVNARVALEKAHTLRPDIVISDIRMPEGDGMRLAKKLPEILPNIRMIMLSGYSDMEYMIEAIKLGVRDYLLKPAGSAQILQSVLKLRDEIVLEQQKEQQNFQMETLINESLDTLKSHFLDDLLTGTNPADSAAAKADMLQIPLHGPYYVCFLAHPRQGAQWEMLQLLSYLMREYSPALRVKEAGSIAAILNVDAPLSEDVILSVVSRMEDLADPMRLACVGTPCTLEQLPGLYAVCEEMSSRSIWFETPYLMATQKGMELPPLPERDLMICERSIVQNVRGAVCDPLKADIDTLFLLLERNKPDIETFKDILLGIARSVRVFSENNELLNRLETLFQSRYDVRMAKECLMTLCASGYSQYGQQVRNALLFINQNHMNDISLTDVANALYISPSYLTRLLKSKTGRGFNDWLHCIRIDHAKELLEKSDLRHYEIAEQVGYRSYKLFSEYFSKIAGCSARAYRETMIAPTADRAY